MALTFFLHRVEIISEGWEQRPAYYFPAGPGDERKQEHQRQPEKYEGGLVLFAVICQLFDLAAANVYQGYGSNGQHGVLYAEEAEAFVAHGRAHIAEGCLSNRAYKEQDDAQQELDV